MYTTESLGRTNERHTFKVFFLKGGYFSIMYGLATSGIGYWLVKDCKDKGKDYILLLFLVSAGESELQGSM